MENEILLQILKEIKEVKADVNELKEGQAKLEEGQAKLEEGQAKLEEGQAKMEIDIQFLKETLLNMENEHGKKLDALFDGYNLLYDISKEVRVDIVRLKADQESNDLNITWLHSQKKAT